MRRIVLVSTLFILVPVIASAQSLEGVWTVVEMVFSGGPDKGRHTEDVQPQLVIFTKSHYSTTFVRGFEARPQWSDNPTDEERLSAFRAFNANAGTYKLEGSTITYTTIVGKSPRQMPPFQYRVKIEWVNSDSFWASLEQPTAAWEERVRFERVE